MKNEYSWLYPLGEMSQRIAENDWSKSPLGSPDMWPSTLKASINLILASSYPAYVWWGPQYIVFYNDAYIALAGSLKHKTALGNPAREMWPEIWSLLEEFINEARTTLKPVWRENLLMPLERNGVVEEAYFSFSFNPLLNEMGEFSGINCICSELTELHISQKSLQENQRQLMLALKGGNMGTWVIDLSTGSFIGDDRFNEIHGIPSARHDIEDTIANRIHPEDADKTAKLLTTAISENGIYSAEYRMLQPDKNYRWVYSRGEVVKNSAGEAVGMSGVSVDIQEQKITEENLLQAVISRDEFLSIASHELKTPLTSLKLQAQLHQRLIKKDHPDAFAPQRVKEFVSQTERQVLRLTRLVDDMLDVSRIRSDKMTIIRSSFDICELLRETANFLEDQFLKSHQSKPMIETEPESIEVNWDKFRIEQVLFNLFTNAIRYGDKKPVRAKISEIPAGVRIEVADEGVGIALESREKIFDRFERAIHANEVSGLGLGLFISRQIVNAHGGKIWVEENSPRGSKFIVELPK